MILTRFPAGGRRSRLWAVLAGLAVSAPTVWAQGSDGYDRVPRSLERGREFSAAARTAEVPRPGPDPEAEGELSVIFRIGQKTSAEFDSFEELGRSLRQDLGVRYGSTDEKAIEVVFAAVLVAADGKVLSGCASEPFLLEAGGTRSIPDLCDERRYGTIFGGPAVGTLEPSGIELGEMMVVEHDERYATDMRPLSIIDAVASRIARQMGRPVLLVGALPADPEAARGVRSSFRAWPCRW